MKNILFIYLLIGLFILSCSGDDDANVEPDDPGAQISVNDISLDVTRITTPVTPNNPQNYSVWFTMAGNKVFYANASNSPVTQFMLSYNLENNTFSPLATHEEVCACGYSSKMVSDGSSLYYIANEAWKYSIGNNTWAALNYPENVHENNGEAGIVYKDGRIYFLGGRDATTRFKYYETATDTWFNSSDYLYAVGTPDLTVVDGRIYALGGDEGKKKFNYFTEASGWTALPDLPFEALNYYDQHSVASFSNRYIFVLVSNQVNVYDTQEQIWRDTPIPVNISGNYKNLFSDNINLYIASKTNDNEFSLHRITVNF